MSTEDLNQEQSDDLQMPSELDLLKQRATLMGIAFSNNIGEETLRQRIADKQAELREKAEKEKEEKARKQAEALARTAK